MKKRTVEEIDAKLIKVGENVIEHANANKNELSYWAGYEKALRDTQLYILGLTPNTSGLWKDDEAAADVK